MFLEVSNGGTEDTELGSSNAGGFCMGIEGRCGGEVSYGGTKDRCLKPRLQQTNGGGYQRLIQMCFGVIILAQKSITQVQHNALKNTKNTLFEVFWLFRLLCGIHKMLNGHHGRNIEFTPHGSVFALLRRSKSPACFF